jgi:DNA polymerase IV
MRKVIHVDMDAFFATIEQRDDPSLRGLPIAVGGSSRRGVVMTASYEARPFGVRSAMPTARALRLCPELIVIRPRFAAYKEASAAIRAVFACWTPLVEPLSLDEAYLDVTDAASTRPAVEIARAIKAEIARRTGLTASAGASFNKFLAKLASDQRKPNGQFVITPEMGPAFVEGLEVSRFHGVGPATAAKMGRLGIRTGRDLRECSLAFLQEHFGKAGAHFHAIARGEDDRPVLPNRPRKSAGSETTYPRDLGDPGEVEAGIQALADEVWAWCERTGAFGRTVTVKLRYADFRTVVNADEVSSEVLDENSPVGGAATRLAEDRLSVVWAACPGAEAVGAAV